MARRIAAATGNLSAAGTWKTSDATALLDSEASNAVLTTSYVTSSTFTPGAITIDGIAVKVAALAASPTGTITVALDQAGGDVAGTPVTINAADIDACSVAANEGGWYLFKFAAPVTLAGATAYSVKAKTSSAAQVTLYTNATANNWSRQLRTTTTGAPAAGDVMDVIGEHTGAGTGNSFTVTNDLTATTDFGAGTDGVVAMTIGKRGTLTYGSSASTAYYLKLSGDLIVYSGGALNIGTVATPIPTTSTAVLEFDPVADGGMGLQLRNGSTTVLQGASIATTATTMTADKAAAATTLTLASTSGWVNGGTIAIASTTRTAADTEKKAITTVDSATQVTIPGLTNAHGGGGTALVIAEVIYLDRYVKIRSATSTLMAYVVARATANLDADYAEFYYLGENAAGKRGIEIETTTGVLSINRCSLHDFEDGGFWLPSGTGASLTNNVLYNCNNAAAASTGQIVIIAGAGATITGNTILGGSATTFGIVDLASTATIVFDTNTVAGGTGTGVRSSAASTRTMTGNTVHSCSSIGVSLSALATLTFASWTVWRNNSDGVRSSGPLKITYDTCTLFGNLNRGIGDAAGSAAGTFVLKTCTLNGDATFATAEGIGAGGGEWYLFGCSFGVTNGHTSYDVSSPTNATARVTCWNCTFASTTEFQPPNAYAGWVRSHKHDASGTTFKTQYAFGVIQSETTTRHTASGYSWKLTPSSATQKLRLPGPTEYDGFRAAVNASALVTVKAWVRKDSSYNGNAPRLVLIGGIVGGIAADVVATLSVGADTWEELTVTGTPNETGAVEWYIDADSTAGNCFVDDLTVSQA